MSIRWIGGVILAGVATISVTAGSIAGADNGVVVTAPVKPLDIEWARRTHCQSGKTVQPSRAKIPVVPATRGPNLTAEGIRLVSDVTVERGVLIRSRISNTGRETLTTIGLDFYLGHPDSGGTCICDGIIIPEISPGESRIDSVAWEGMTGSGRIFCCVDVDNVIPEDDETDNISSLTVSLRDDIPWVWQIVNGYCSYASLAMIFNWAGADHTVYETVEFASCPHSIVYIDDTYYLPGGIMISQSSRDYEFAGDLRSMDTDLQVAATWEQYRLLLRTSIDSGTPFMTSVDPYYLPEEDYADLWEYGLHGGHAVVVTGYTDSSVVINDPGVGLGLIDDPIPNPELRGADVVVGWGLFRDAVEMTLGTPRILVSFCSDGPIPSEDEMLSAVLEQSMARLGGDTASYDDAWIDYWPPGWIPSFGGPALETAASDMNMATFQAAFDGLMEEENNDLEAVVLTMASYLGDGLFWTQIGWEASEEYYVSLPGEDAESMVLVSRTLAQRAASAYATVIDLIMALWNSGGNTSLAGPYLQQLETDFDSMARMEETALVLLGDILAMGSMDPTIPKITGITPLLCSPNPFGSTVSIHAGPTDAVDEIEVYDVTGRRVRILTCPVIRDEYRIYSWNGRDTNGSLLPAGTYIFREPDGAAIRAVRTN